jgi:hypothetical protein
MMSLHPGGRTASEPIRAHSVSAILGAFRDLPGLRLHISQAARLLGLRLSAVILADLVAQGQLRRDDGQYFDPRELPDLGPHGQRPARRSR